MGLASYHFSEKNQNLKNCRRRTPVGISLVVGICMTLMQFYLFYVVQFGVITTLMTYTLYVSIFLSNLSANWQCWYYESTYQNMIYLIQRLEKQFKFKFATVLSLKSMSFWYKINAALVLGCFAISAAIVLFQSWSITNRSSNAVVIALFATFKEFMCALAVLHFSLYVDIVRMFLTELNRQIRQPPICLSMSTKVLFLKDVKSIHYDIFLLMKQVNTFFGWSLLLLMINYFILITYSFYWLFFTLQVNVKSYSLIGNLKKKKNRDKPLDEFEFLTSLSGDVHKWRHALGFLYGDLTHFV